MKREENGFGIITADKTFWNDHIYNSEKDAEDHIFVVSTVSMKLVDGLKVVPAIKTTKIKQALPTQQEE